MNRQIQHEVTIGEDDIWLLIRHHQVRARRLQTAIRTLGREIHLPSDVYRDVEETAEDDERLIEYLHGIIR